MGKVVAALLWALLVAGPAAAVPVTYLYTSGQVELTATTDPGGVTILSTTVIPIDGVSVTFDASTVDLVDFLFTIPTTGIISLDTPYGGYDQFRIESADLSPGIGYTTLLGSDDGGGNYSFVAGPVDINGVYSAFDSTNTNPDLLNVVAPFTDTSLISGSININTGELTLNGITLAQLPGAFFGETDDLSIKADITFVGAELVPEPSSAVLLGLGLLGMTSLRRRSARN